MYIKKIKHLII